MAKAGGAGVATGFAPAKINLTLHVTGQRADGFHLLDSLVAFADVGDHLTAETARQSSLTVSGPMAEGVPQDESNLILRAARWMGVHAAFTLDKHLPAAAGIGGGSSDAAAALRLLAALSGQEIPEGSEALGADVPVCLLPVATRMRGIGEQLDRTALPPLPAVLVNPGVAVPTGGVFAGLATKVNAAMDEVLPDFGDARDAAAWIATQRNDLEAPAICEQPKVRHVLDALAGLPDALLARMSGSGATCFALFSEWKEAREAEVAMMAQHPDWWVKATVLS